MYKGILAVCFSQQHFNATLEQLPTFTWVYFILYESDVIKTRKVSFLWGNTESKKIQNEETIIYYHVIILFKSSFEYKLHKGGTVYRKLRTVIPFQLSLEYICGLTVLLEIKVANLLTNQQVVGSQWGKYTWRIVIISVTQSGRWMM